MTSPAAERETDAAELNALAMAAADDLLLLARLHDREPDGALLETLRQVSCRDWFGLHLSGPEAETAFQVMDQWLATLPVPADQQTIDELAADFAELYLLYAKRVSPSESVWLTEDHLERQEPMFAVREWYRQYGVAVPDWRIRPDDHLVHQLEFLAELVGRGELDSLRDAGRLLDQHLMLWIGDFAGLTAKRADVPFFAALAMLTLVEITTLRRLLEAITGEPRAIPETGNPARAARQEVETRFIPGTAPGW